jgi:hypothetical protein
VPASALYATEWTDNAAWGVLAVGAVAVLAATISWRSWRAMTTVVAGTWVSAACAITYLTISGFLAPSSVLTTPEAGSGSLVAVGYVLFIYAVVVIACVVVQFVLLFVNDLVGLARKLTTRT